MTHGLKIKICDVLLIFAILITAILLMLLPLFSDRKNSAEIVLIETGEVRSISLDSDAEYPIDSRGIHLIVCVENGTAFVSESDCRDGICRGTRPISRAGQSIVCLPAGVMIRISGEEAIVDGVSG